LYRENPTGESQESQRGGQNQGEAHRPWLPSRREYHELVDNALNLALSLPAARGLTAMGLIDLRNFGGEFLICLCELHSLVEELGLKGDVAGLICPTLAEAYECRSKADGCHIQLSSEIRNGALQSQISADGRLEVCDVCAEVGLIAVRKDFKPFRAIVGNENSRAI
jgi:hypothetical protein